MGQLLLTLVYDSHGALGITVGTNGALGDKNLGRLVVAKVS